MAPEADGGVRRTGRRMSRVPGCWRSPRRTGCMPAGWRRCGPGATATAGPRSHIEHVLAPLAPGAALVTVLDGHPATHAWLGAVRGQRVVPLGWTISGRAATSRTCTGNTGSTRTRFWMPARRRCWACSQLTGLVAAAGGCGRRCWACRCGWLRSPCCCGSRGWEWSPRPGAVAAVRVPRPGLRDHEPAAPRFPVMAGSCQDKPGHDGLRCRPRYVILFAGWIRPRPGSGRLPISRRR